MARTWRMFAGRPSYGRPEEGREFANFGADWYVRLYGHEPVAVELIEDPDGGYYGWIEAESQEARHEYTGIPEMIQPHEGMFSMQFAYGPQAEIERGRGEIVRMSCRAVAADT